MNVIELVREIISSFPDISEVCGGVSVDFTDEKDKSYGLSPTGDMLVKEDILGNQTRQHTFVLFAVFQSMNDYDRLENSAVLLRLSQYLENKAENQKITQKTGNETFCGKLTGLTCANGMLYEIPNENFTCNVRYQLQITAEYTLEREAI